MKYKGKYYDSCNYILINSNLVFHGLGKPPDKVVVTKTKITIISNGIKMEINPIYLLV